MTKLLSILLATLLLPMTACDDCTQWDAFDPETEGIVDVVTKATVLYGIEPFDHVETNHYYYTVAAGQRVQLTEAFIPDAMTTIYVPVGDLKPGIGSGWARRISGHLRDSQGNPFPANGDLERILEQLEALDHSFLRVRIFEVSGEYFPYVELNVNLWDPCRLYHYDREGDALVELNTWDGEKVVGLRLRNPVQSRK